MKMGKKTTVVSENCCQWVRVVHVHVNINIMEHNVNKSTRHVCLSPMSADMLAPPPPDTLSPPYVRILQPC